MPEVATGRAPGPPARWWALAGVALILADVLTGRGGVSDGGNPWVRGSGLALVGVAVVVGAARIGVRARAGGARRVALSAALLPVAVVGTGALALLPAAGGDVRRAPEAKQPPPARSDAAAPLHAGHRLVAEDRRLDDLRRALAEGGTSAALDRLAGMAASDRPLTGVMPPHRYAYAIGGMAYARDGLRAAQRDCDRRFAGGCHQGAVDSYIADHPGLAGADLVALCGRGAAARAGAARYFCLHAVGHHLSRRSRGRPAAQVRHCDELPALHDRRLCASGVFMQAAATATAPRSLCLGVPHRYARVCQRYRAVAVLRRTGRRIGDALPVACGRPGTRERQACEGGVGGAIGFATDWDARSTARLCRRQAAPGSARCVEGAIAGLVAAGLPHRRPEMFCAELGVASRGECRRFVRRITAWHFGPRAGRAPQGRGPAAVPSLRAAPAVRPPRAPVTGQTERISARLRAVVRRAGTRAALRELSRLGRVSPPVARRAHRYVHEIGEMAHDTTGDVGAAFRSCDGSVDAGCYHGVLRAHLSGRVGIAPAEVRRFCRGAPINTSAREVLRFQCLHGLGHGLYVLFRGRLGPALRHCDALRAEGASDPCYGGAFMEWTSRSIRHPGHRHGATSTRVGNAERCAGIARRYRWQCHVYTTRVRSARRPDVADALGSCDQREPPYAAACYQGVGANISVLAPARPRRMAALCALGRPSYRLQCLRGAVLNLIGIDQTARRAMRLCRASPADLGDACVEVVGGALPDLGRRPSGWRRSCAESGDPRLSAVCERSARLPGPRPAARRSPRAEEALARRVARCATAASQGRLVTCQAAALAPVFRSRGADRGIAVVSRLTADPRLRAFRASCHRTLHQVAADYARQHGVTMARLKGLLLPTYGPGCASGFNHGLIIHAGAHLGPGELVATERRICGGIGHRFGRHACDHGVGHAFMVIADGDLRTALRWCRRLGPVAEPDCADAAFHGTALRPSASRPPDPDRLCRGRRGAVAQVCWRRAWTSVLEYQGARHGLDAGVWPARCERAARGSRAGCITAFSRHATARPEAGLDLCLSLRRPDQVACLRGVVVSRLPPGDVPAQSRLIARCRRFAPPTHVRCVEILGRNLNVLTNGRFERAGCRRLDDGPLRHACRRGSRRYTGALLTYG